MADNEQISAPAVTTSPTPVASESQVTSTETIASQVPAVTEAAITTDTTPASPAPNTDPVAEVTEDPKEASKEETKEATKDSAPNILGGDTAPKVDAPAAEEKPTEVAKEPIVELPTYEDFALPENFTPDKEGISAFSKILGELELNAKNLDHAAFQAKGQELISLGAKAIEDSITRLNDYYVTLHQQQKDGWFEALKNDPELGRNRIDTTISTVQKAVKDFAGTEEQVAEFRQLMNDTGVTNNPSLIRLIHNMQQRINKYESEESGPSIRPASRPVPVKVKPHELFYGGTGGGK